MPPAASKIRTLAKSGVKRQAILDAAAKVFRERGYANVRLGDIAAEAGTQAGSLYYYFDSREALVEKVLEISMQKTAQHVADELAALSADASALQRVEVAVRAHIDSILTLDDYLVAYQKIINQVPEQIQQHFLHFPRAYAKVWRDLITTAQNAGELRPELDPTLMRLLLLGSIAWTLEWFKPSGRNSPGQVADHVVSIFFQGMANPEAVAALPAAVKPARRRRKPALVK